MTQKTETTKRRGAVIPSTGKTRVTMYLDDDVIEHYRVCATARGRGYQTEINAVLRETMEAGDKNRTGVETTRICIEELFSQVQDLRHVVGHIETVVVKGFRKIPDALTMAGHSEHRRAGGGEGKVVMKEVKRTAKRPIVPSS